MTKKVTITYTITYNLSNKSASGREYQEWLDGDKDTKSARKWFVIDRFIGHDNLALFDKNATLKIEEV